MESRLKYVNGQYIKMTDEEIAQLENQPRDIQGEIEQLKQKISALDYYTDKTYMAEKLGLPEPYTYEELLAVENEKQGYRDQINALEAELNTHNG